MADYIQIGALVEKDHGLSAYGDISSLKGVLYAFLTNHFQLLLALLAPYTRSSKPEGCLVLCAFKVQDHSKF